MCFILEIAELVRAGTAMQATHDIAEKSAAAEPFNSATANTTQMCKQQVWLTWSAYEGFCRPSTLELSLKNTNSYNYFKKGKDFFF